MCLIGTILQCGLSVGKLNLAVNLVQWISMQITLYICKEYIPGHFHCILHGLRSRLVRKDIFPLFATYQHNRQAGDKVNLPGTTTFPNWHFYRVVNQTVVAASFLCIVYYMRLNNLCNY